MKLYILITCIFFNLISSVRAQVNVEFPYSRLVFQRNTLGKGEILVSGYSEITADIIQARLLPFAVSTGRATDWINCHKFKVDPLQNFSVVLQATQGWYNLQVRAIKDAVIIADTIILRIGIGEVFLIAGQSNAQGQVLKESRGSSDLYGRVGVFASYDEYMDSPSFNAQSLSNDINIYPVGVTSWCWAELGDKIAKRLNVPVFFLNAAWSGTDSESWVASMDSLGTHDQNRKCVPYGFLHRSIQFYRNVLGLRAVLWHQGEADSFRNDLNASGVPIDYFGNMQKVIAASKEQAGSKLAWVVSQASLIYGTKDSLIIAAQRRLVAELPDVFAGPYTDTLTDARLDGVHFTNEFNKKGLSRLADAWNQALDSTFFQSAVPMLPSFGKHAFVPDNGNVIAPSGFSSKGRAVEKKSFAFIADTSGNYYASPLLPCGIKPRLSNNQLKYGVLSEITNSRITKQVILNNKVTESNNVIYSRKSVVLNPGFVVESPTTFTAEIGGCY
jgi:catechol 2,3-dioxygenase-like lactoylglutathione lyase family enzyme